MTPEPRFAVHLIGNALDCMIEGSLSAGGALVRFCDSSRRGQSPKTRNAHRLLSVSLGRVDLLHGQAPIWALLQCLAKMFQGQGLTAQSQQN